MGSSRDALVKELRRFRKRIARRYGIERMILFGSQARGVARKDSDVDLIVVSPRFRRKNAIDRAYPLHLEWDLGRPVDFLCYTPEEFRELSRRPSIVREAVREGVPIPA
jgi:predicted nucleotidyltransferase